jgi:hypothetical protein
LSAAFYWIKEWGLTLIEQVPTDKSLAIKE